jgi:hypothetical protein
MESQTTKTFVLVWHYCGKVEALKQGSIQLCQMTRSALIASQHPGELIIRTLEGFKNNPFWKKKNGNKL